MRRSTRTTEAPKVTKSTPRSDGSNRGSAVLPTGLHDRPAQPIRLLSVSVKRGRLACDIAIAEERCRYTDSVLAAHAMADFPDLAEHACVNGVAPKFGAVIESTSTAHLLEHIAISLQTRSAHDSAACFVGTSEWVDEARGIAHLELSFRDDLEGLGAFNEALNYLNTAVITCLP